MTNWCEDTQTARGEAAQTALPECICCTSAGRGHVRHAQRDRSTDVIRGMCRDRCRERERESMARHPELGPAKKVEQPLQNVSVEEGE